MALKDTLVRLKRQQESADSLASEQPRLKDEWIAAVSFLIDDLKKFLAPFESEGALVVHEGERVITEDVLGTYTVRAATIEAGPAKIEIIPVGRVVVGAVGRVDLSRQGFAKSSQRILMLRLQEANLETKRWMLRMPVEIGLGGLSRFEDQTRQFDFQYLPLDSENVEKAIDFLLSL